MHGCRGMGRRRDEVSNRVSRIAAIAFVVVSVVLAMKADVPTLYHIMTKNIPA